MALSNKNGTTDFHLADHVGSSSPFTNSSEEAMLNSDHTIAKTFPVKTARLDDWCAKQSIDHISCVKMDAQGSEFSILQGGKKMLARQAIDIIMLEWFTVPQYDGVPMLDEILTLLRSHKYGLYDIFPSRRLSNGQLRFGDAVLISESFRKNHLPSPKGA